MSDQKRRKHRKIRIVPLWIRISGILLITAVLLLFVTTALLPRFGIDLNLPFSSHTRISESEILLKELRPLFLLQTVEYTYKNVFPYDFIPPHVDPLTAYRRLVQGSELSSQEKEAAELYRLCMETGIRLGGYDYTFIVITTRIKGGFDFNESPVNSESVSTNPGMKSISITLPQPKITEFIIQDETSSQYGYPDIEVDAEQWRKISKFVEQKIRTQVINDGILEKTEQNIREVLSKVLQETGWKYISFNQ